MTQVGDLYVRGKVLLEVVTLVNIYAPTCDDLNFFQSLFLKLSEVEGDIIIAGDLNLTLNTKLDRSSNKNPRTCRSRTVINSYMKDLGLCDIWRYTHPKTKEYSFFSPISLYPWQWFTGLAAANIYLV